MANSSKICPLQDEFRFLGTVSGQGSVGWRPLNSLIYPVSHWTMPNKLWLDWKSWPQIFRSTRTIPYKIHQNSHKSYHTCFFSKSFNWFLTTIKMTKRNLVLKKTHQTFSNHPNINKNTPIALSKTPPKKKKTKHKVPSKLWPPKESTKLFPFNFTTPKLSRNPVCIWLLPGLQGPKAWQKIANHQGLETVFATVNWVVGGWFPGIFFGFFV